MGLLLSIWLLNELCNITSNYPGYNFDFVHKAHVLFSSTETNCDMLMFIQVEAFITSEVR